LPASPDAVIFPGAFHIDFLSFPESARRKRCTHIGEARCPYLKLPFTTITPGGFKPSPGFLNVLKLGSTRSAIYQRSLNLAIIYHIGIFVRNFKLLNSHFNDESHIVKGMEEFWRWVSGVGFKGSVQPPA